MLRTKFQKEKDARDIKVRKLYKQLAANPDNPKTAIEQKVMEKFSIKSRSHLWGIVSGANNEGVGSNLNPRI